MTPVYCPVCDRWARGLDPGPAGRPAAACPRCGSLERHRVAAILFPYLLSQVAPDGIVLEAAPQSGLTEVLGSLVGDSLFGFDIDPSQGRPIDFVASITDLPLRGGSCRFIYYSHVLEHVVDDEAGMRELARVLGDRGLAYIQVPRRKGAPTEEAPDAAPAERRARFGQDDHVRLYGDDFEARMARAGLLVATTTVDQVMPRPLIELIGAKAHHELWMVGTATDPATFIEPFAVVDGLIVGGAEKSQSALRSLRHDLDAATSEAEHWRGAYAYLRGRLPVRMLASVNRLIRARRS